MTPLLMWDQFSLPGMELETLPLDDLQLGELDWELQLNRELLL